MQDRPPAALLSRIAEHLRTRGFSRRALAQRAGVRPETLSRIASRGTCDFATLERLAAAGLRLGIQDEPPPASGQGHAEVLRRQALIRTLAKAHGAKSIELFGSAPRAARIARAATWISWSNWNRAAACST